MNAGSHALTPFAALALTPFALTPFASLTGLSHRYFVREPIQYNPYMYMHMHMLHVHVHVHAHVFESRILVGYCITPWLTRGKAAACDSGHVQTLFEQAKLYVSMLQSS